MPSSHLLDPIVLPPSFELAVSASVLHDLVHAHVDRFSSQPAEHRQIKLRRESRPTMPLLIGQTDVGNLLLWPRIEATAGEVLLLSRVVCAEVLTTIRSRLLFQEIDGSIGVGENNTGPTQYQPL